MRNYQARTSRRGLLAVCRGCVILLMVIGASAGFAQDRGASDLEYQIGPDDLLDISVWKEESLQRKVVVRPDGKISFPLIGEVQAASHSAEEIQNDITQRLKKYIPDPVVTVVIDKVSAYKIYVIGEVKNSGQYQVGHYLDVVQALALAGGLTPYAAENKIKILRRENNVVTVIPFEYAKVEAGIELKQNIILKRGDVVIVP